MAWWRLYRAPSRQYAVTRAWIFGALGLVMVVVGAIATDGATTLIGFVFCLFAVGWAWHAGRVRRHGFGSDE